jgi:hypothetical protein
MTNTIVAPMRPNENSCTTRPARDESARTKVDIANLSLADIRQMRSDELVEMIRFADVPLFRGSAIEHLPYSDRATLERLAFLARRTVRNQGY